MIAFCHSAAPPLQSSFFFTSFFPIRYLNALEWIFRIHFQDTQVTKFHLLECMLMFTCLKQNIWGMCITLYAFGCEIQKVSCFLISFYLNVITVPGTLKWVGTFLPLGCLIFSCSQIDAVVVLLNCLQFGLCFCGQVRTCSEVVLNY